MAVYAVIEDGGKQYRVEKGMVVDLEKKPLEVGAQVEFGRVLLTSDGQNVQVGRPVVEGAKVLGEVTDQLRGKKLTILMYRRRKNYRRKMGHRQSVMRVRITDIIAPTA